MGQQGRKEGPQEASLHPRPRPLPRLPRRRRQGRHPKAPSQDQRQLLPRRKAQGRRRHPHPRYRQGRPQATQGPPTPPPPPNLQRRLRQAQQAHAKHAPPRRALHHLRLPPPQDRPRPPLQARLPPRQQPTRQDQRQQADQGQVQQR